MYEFTTSTFLTRLLRLVLWGAHLPLLLAVLWVIGLFFCHPVCALLLIPFIIIIMWRLSQQKLQHVRMWLAVFCLAEFGLFLALPGPSARHWQDGVAREHIITGPVNGIVHINFIRDFIYHGRKPADIRYLEEDFDINDLTGVYLAECFSGKGMTDCKLMLSFAFRDGRYLVISPEMRVPANEKENGLRKYYNNYGLFYLFGTEEDLFALHTNEHHDYLSIYPLKAAPEQAQAMLTACLRLAADAQEKHRAYNPLQQAYYNDLLDVLCVICPALAEAAPTHNADVAKQLYRNGATLISEKGEWTRIRRRYAIGFDIHPDVRETYSDVIRRRFDGVVRETLPERHAQDLSSDALLSKRVAQRAPTGAPVTTTKSGADTPLSADRGTHNETDKQDTPADTPPIAQATSERNAEKKEGKETKTTDVTLNAVINKDDTEAVAAATRELDKGEQLLPRRASVADGILEPGARLYADNRKEEEYDESRTKSAEKRDIMDNDEAQKKEGSQFNELFFGKRKSGITIIEKEKPKPEAHPLDPIRKQKRKNPFDEEDRKRQENQRNPQEVDPFAPKEPIRI